MTGRTRAAILGDWAGVIVACMIALLPGCDRSSSPAPPTPRTTRQTPDGPRPLAGRIETADLTFTSSEGFVFDARVTQPPSERRNGFGVLLMGGGVGNDLEWSVPGWLEIDGTRRQVTITGDPHADAPRLAQALAARGYVVMHWSTIRHGDPKADWPRTITTYPMPTMLEHARLALATFREQKLVPPDRIILVGHSLGAARACHIAATDADVAGLVLLAGAGLVRTGSSGPRPEAARRIAGQIDADGDGRRSSVEFDRFLDTSPGSPLSGVAFTRLDFDGDGTLALWEISAQLTRSERTPALIASSPTDAHGQPWGEDVIAGGRRPVLCIYGARDDAQAYQAPLLDDRRVGAAAEVTIRVYANLGHALGREEGGRIGPIDDIVLRAITDWLDDRFARHR